MCMVSNAMDYGRGIWPYNPPTPEPAPFAPFAVPQVERIPTPEEWAAFLDLVEKARKFDELTGQPDCEDPEKAQWMKAIEERLEALEDWRAS